MNGCQTEILSEVSRHTLIISSNSFQEKGLDIIVIMLCIKHRTIIYLGVGVVPTTFFFQSPSIEVCLQIFHIPPSQVTKCS